MAFPDLGFLRIFACLFLRLAHRGKWHRVAMGVKKTSCGKGATRGGQTREFSVGELQLRKAIKQIFLLRSLSSRGLSL
jgi:hypothetical protein